MGVSDVVRSFSNLAALASTGKYWLGGPSSKNDQFRGAMVALRTVNGGLLFGPTSDELNSNLSGDALVVPGRSQISK